MTPLESLLDQLLADLTIDWMNPSWATGTAGYVVESVEDRTTMALGVVASSILGGWAVPGSVDSSGFEPMVGSAIETVAGVAERWLSLPVLPARPGDVCWLALTDSGTERGHAVIDARDHVASDEPGQGKLNKVRDLLTKPTIELGDLIEAVEIDPLTYDDRNAAVLGAALEAIVMGHARVQGTTGDLATDIDLLYQSLQTNHHLTLQSTPH